MNTSSGGTYYVKVSRGAGSYSLAISLQSQNDAGLGGDAGDEILEALQIELGPAFSGEIGDYDLEDWYKFEVPQGHALSVAFTSDEDAIQKMTVELIDPERERVWNEVNIGPSEAKSVSVAAETVSGGTYYVKVSRGSGGYGVEIE